MSGRQLQFYFLLDLIPSLIMFGILFILTTVILVLIGIAHFLSGKNEEHEAEKCKCEQPCNCEKGCSCCGGSSKIKSLKEAGDALNNDMQWIMKYFFTYAWNKKKNEDSKNDAKDNEDKNSKEDKKNDKQSNEENDMSDKKSEEISSKSNKSNEDKESSNFDLNDVKFNNPCTLGIFIIAAALCLETAFVVFWDSMLIRSRQDNCVETLDCYIFNGQGGAALYNRPINCSVDMPNSNSSKIFCYAIDLDIPQGFSAAGSALILAAIEFLTLASIIANTNFLKVSHCSSTGGKVIYHVICIILAIICIIIIVVPKATQLDLQTYLLSDVTNPLKASVFSAHIIVAFNIPWYLVKKNGNSSVTSIVKVPEDLKKIIKSIKPELHGKVGISNIDATEEVQLI